MYIFIPLRWIVVELRNSLLKGFVTPQNQVYLPPLYVLIQIQLFEHEFPNRNFGQLRIFGVSNLSANC